MFISAPWRHSSHVPDERIRPQRHHALEWPLHTFQFIVKTKDSQTIHDIYIILFMNIIYYVFTNNS